MDEKVCEAFLHRQAVKSRGFFHFGSMNSQNLINSLSSQSIFISGRFKLFISIVKVSIKNIFFILVLGFFGFVLLFVFLVIISVHFKRSRMAKKRRKFIDEHRQTRSFSDNSSDNFIDDYHYPHLIEDNNNHLNKSNNIHSNKKVHKESNLFEHKSNVSANIISNKFWQ